VFRVLLLSVLAATATIDRAVASPIGGSPRAVVRVTGHDVGRVARGTVLTELFTIENAGSAPLLIESMQFSSPGIRARVAQSIEPGKSAELTVDWDTSSYTRDAEVQVALQLNDPTSPQLVLALSGFVVSPIELDPVPAFYLSQFAGERSSQTVTLRNNTDRAIEVTGTMQEGKHFTLTVAPGVAGRSFELTATADPDLPPGQYQESAWILTDSPERPKIRLDVNILVKPEVFASVDAIDLGSLRLATIKADPSVLELLQQTVILESRSAKLRVTRIESDLPFVVVRHDAGQAAPQSAGPPKRVRLDVSLDPTRLQAGAYAGNIRVFTGLPSYPVVTLHVTMSVVN
jgi:hypothetical protein